MMGLICFEVKELRFLVEKYRQSTITLSTGGNAEMIEIAEACPQFIRCAVNNCPLHSGYPGLSTSSLDSESRCQLGKVARVKIADQFPKLAASLKYGGLTQREFAAKRRYESLSEEGKEELIERAKKAREVRTNGERVK